MAITQTQVSELYVSIFGRASEGEGNTYWQTKDSTTAAANEMYTLDVVKDYFNVTDFTSEANVRTVVETIYLNALGKAPADDVDGINYWVNEVVVNGVSMGQMTDALITAAKDLANAGVAQTTFINKVAVSDYTADTIEEFTDFAQFQGYIAGVDETDSSVAAAKVDVNADIPVDPGVEGAIIRLTSGTDRGGEFDGTENNDQFNAFIEQNEFAGGISNSLSSADHLNGGAGSDSLYAELTSEFSGVDGGGELDVQPRTANIEKVEIEARENAAGDNVITLDAKYMTEVKEIGSKMSDADLKIENLTTLKNGAIDSVSSMTITMDHTDNMNSDNNAADLTVLFDEDYLTPTTSFGQSGIEFKMMNQDAYDANGGADRLDGVYVRKMVITLEGVEYDLAQYIEEDGETGLGAEFKTETDLVAHLNAVVLPALKADNPAAAVAMESLIFSIGDTWNDANQNRIGDIIVLSVSNEFSLTIGSTDLELAQAENVPNDYASNRIERADNFEGANTESISVNVMLDKVGRDGEGGNLVVGGKNQDENGDTDVDQTDGIPTINVTVNGDEDRPSNLGRITSTNDALLNVNIVSESRNDGSYAALTVRGEVGDLDMQGGSNPFGGTLESLNANSFLGDLAVGINTAALNIDTFTATGGGDVTLVETIDGTEQAGYMVTTGEGADNITVDLNGNAVNALQTGLAIATAAGNDTVTVTGTGNVSDATTLGLNNLSIATGAGEDTVYVNAEHIYRVNTGVDSDFVVVDADNAANPQGLGSNGLWTIGDGTDSLNTDWADTVLYEAILTVDFAGFSQAVLVRTNASGNFIATQEDINNAVISAISGNPELARLLTATASTGTAQSQLLTIVSTVQGVNDLTISVNQPTVVLTAGAGVNDRTVSSSEYAAIEAGLIATGEISSAFIPNNTEAEVVAALNLNAGNLNEMGVSAANNFVLDAADGIDGTNNAGSTSHAIIDMGAGANDLVVLDSDVDSADTLVFTSSWNQGKVSVLNFFNAQFNDQGNANVADTTIIDHTIADEVIGLHEIDFTFWLDDQDTISGSSASALRTATTDVVTAANAIDLSDNEVTIVNNFAQDGTETWAAMSATDVDTALTGTVATDDYGLTGAATAISDASTTVLAANALLGSSIDSILMVENDLNNGEYKVFNVETTNVDTGTEAFTVTLLGVIDFGETIDAAAVFA